MFSRIVPLIASALLVSVYISVPGVMLAAADDELTSSPDIYYGRAGGQDLLLDIFRPVTADLKTTEARLLPALVFVHGGGWSGGDRKGYHQDARWFAKQGFVCFSVGYRLARPDGNKWPAQLDDVQLAVRWVRENASRYGADPKSVGAIGGSAGGHLVAMLAARETRDPTAVLGHHSSRPECVITFAGPSDLTQSFPTTETLPLNVQGLVDNLLGASAADATDLARDASPVTHITAGTSPILIVHGDDDKVVPVNQALILHETMEAKGAPSRLLILRDEGHGLKPENQRIFREKSLSFLQEHLRPENR